MPSTSLAILIVKIKENSARATSTPLLKVVFSVAQRGMPYGGMKVHVSPVVEAVPTTYLVVVTSTYSYRYYI